VITLCNLIKDSRGPDEIIRLYVDFMGENLSEGFLYCFIKHSKNPIKIAELIGLDKFKDLFEDYDFEDKSDFENYIEYSENPSGVRKLLKILGKYK
jgi:hypothetical protein